MELYPARCFSFLTRRDEGDKATASEKAEPHACIQRQRLSWRTSSTELRYFDEFEKPGEANAAILSLYGDLSLYVHAAVSQFQSAVSRERKGEGAGMESVSTLNRFNSLAFQVYDIVLVRMFYGLGLCIAGDIFTSILDDETK